MTMINVRSINEIVSSIRSSHGIVLDLGAERKDLNGAINVAKIEVYAEFVAAIAEIGTLKGGGLTKKQSGLMQQGLLAAGISEACVTRYSANSNGAYKACEGLRDAAKGGKETVISWFKANEIDTETKIRALHVAPVDPLEVLARRVADLTEEQYAALVARVAAIKEEKAPVVSELEEEELASEAA
jgi:hypothetical protein